MSARPYNRYNINFDDTELIKRSKRTRNLLIVVIVLLVLGLGALVYFGITLYNAARTTDNASLIPPYEIGNGKLDDIGVPQAVEFKKTTIPNLSALFGLNIDQVTSSLGSGFKLVKYENSQDSSNPNIVQMAVFSFTPELAEGIDISNTVVLMPTQSVYASFDGNGRVIDIYYVCDLRLLDYPVCTFEELLANDRLLLTALQSAGVTPQGFNYVAPDLQGSISYDNPNSENRRIKKQSHIFSGRIASQSLPTAWTLTVAYDFGSGVMSADDIGKATRSIYIKLA